MNAKEYLKQAFYLDKRINSKLEQVESLNALATKATSTLSDMPKSPNRGSSKLEDTIVKIIDLQEEINRDIDKLVDLKKRKVELGKTDEETSTTKIKSGLSEDDYIAWAGRAILPCSRRRRRSIST